MVVYPNEWQKISSENQVDIIGFYQSMTHCFSAMVYQYLDIEKKSEKIAINFGGQVKLIHRHKITPTNDHENTLLEVVQHGNRVRLVMIFPSGSVTSQDFY